MNTQVKETSLNAYYNVALPRAKTQFDLILKVMEEGKLYTRRELHHLTGIETSTISARVNSLVKKGKIREVGNKRDPYTGVMVEALAKVTGVQLKLI